MRIIEINSFVIGSTGNIMLNIASKARAQNNEVYIFCANTRRNSNVDISKECMIGTRIERKLHIWLSQFTGFNGCFSWFSTYGFLRKADKIDPDIVHLHNLHNSYINLPMFFKWIKKNNKKVIWTLHDCWAFTGQCPHFIVAKCGKWKTGCFNCPRYKEYPESLFDRTKTMYKLKKKWFTGVENLTIVTPSNWLANLVKQSFLRDYPVKVINNGIDLNIFKPIESEFKKEHNIEDKKVLLGCASPWSDRKGLDVFIKLSDMLSEDYKIVLVGLSKEQLETLPKNIIGIERTNNQTELAEIYTMADVFVNPTREDNFPTVNIEALACGTPVITFNKGGSPEIIDETCGCVVKCDDVVSLKNEIVRVCEEKPYSREDCIIRAAQFDMNDKFKEYVDLYDNI
ncbi:MAG: glycosyltransferase [Ruminococcaceae bacterium]|nr:glycosyltransferase [Oscillospiraceae bacterium]